MVEGFKYLNNSRGYVVWDLMPLVASPKAFMLLGLQPGLQLGFRRQVPCGRVFAHSTQLGTLRNSNLDPPFCKSTPAGRIIRSQCIVDWVAVMGHPGQGICLSGDKHFTVGEGVWATVESWVIPARDIRAQALESNYLRGTGLSSNLQLPAVRGMVSRIWTWVVLCYWTWVLVMVCP